MLRKKRHDVEDQQLLEKVKRAYWQAEDIATDQKPFASREAESAYRKSSLSLRLAQLVTRRISFLGLSQADLAERMGVTEGRVSQILSGRQNLTFKTLAALEDALDDQFVLGLRSEPTRPPAELMQREQVRRDHRANH